MTIFTARDAYELGARFDGSLAAGAAGGVKSWLGPMLERCAALAPAPGALKGAAPFGVVEMRVRETRASAAGKDPHHATSLGSLLDAIELAVVNAALARMPPQLVRVLAAHYGPDPPGCEGLEPAELRAVLCLVAGKSPAQLKVVQLKALPSSGHPPCLVASEGLVRLRIRAEKTLFDARASYAVARHPGG